jgi:hypothetical protein
MAQFAPVAPPQVLRALREMGEHVAGRYHLLLAHDVVDHPHLYKDLLPPGSFVILDNSIIELGHPVDARTMRRALEIVPSQVVVLPDMIREFDQTLELSFMAAEQYREFIDFSKTMYMAVPQGTTMAELQKSAQELKYIEGVGCWGIPRHITELLGSRQEFTRWIWDDFDMHLAYRRHGPFIHLLGFSDDMEDDLACCRLPGVMGIDSAVPLRMGQHRQMISKLQKTHVPRSDWWENATSHIYPETIANLSLVRTWTMLERVPGKQLL